MLRIIVEATGRAAKFRLEGKLVGPWVAELEQCWRRAKGVLRSKSFVVDLSNTCFVDSAGQELLARMHDQGAELVASGPMTKSVVEEIKHRRRRGAAPIRRELVTLGLLVVLMLAGRSSARAADKPPLRLTLREAVQTALRQNPQVQIANLNVAQSEQDRVIARSGLLPQVGLDAFDSVRRANIEALAGRRFFGFAQHVGPFQVMQAGPQFSFPVFDLTLWRRLQASRQNVHATRSDEMTAREQNVLLVVSQYLGSLRAAADVRAAQSRVELAQALYNLASDLQKQGVGTGIDTLRANVQLQQERQRLIASETQRKTSLYGLVQLLNLEPGQAIELADEMEFFETPEFGVDESLSRALAARPEMRTIDARQRAVELQKQAASESRLPALRATGFWAQQGLTPANAIPAYQYQLNLDVPVFTGGRLRAEVDRQDLELKKVAQQRNALRSRIGFEVNTALEQLNAARHEVDVANLGAKLAQEEMTQARDRFQAGVANNIEVITAQDELARANDNQIGALFRYNQARADLAHAVGQMENLYAK